MTVTGTADEFSRAPQRQADFAFDNEPEWLRFDAFFSPDDDDIAYRYEAFENMAALDAHRELGVYKSIGRSKATLYRVNRVRDQFMLARVALKDDSPELRSQPSD